MKSSLFKYLYIILILFAGCSKNYFQSSHLSTTFDKSKTYKLAIADPQFTGLPTEANNELMSRTLNHLSIEMQKVKNFTLIDRAMLDRELRIRQFGGNTIVDDATIREAAKATGAQLIMLSTISTEAVKGGLPILAAVQIIDLSNGNTLYQGRARMKNPASIEAGVEFALEKALEELTLKTR